MIIIKKAIRILLLTILLIMAAFGIGLTGNFLNSHKEPYRNNEIKTEQIDKKEEEESEAQIKK